MVTKSATKTIPKKKPVKPPVTQKKPVSQAASPAKPDLTVMLEQHTKQLRQLDEEFNTLQNELKEIRNLIVTEKVTQVDKSRSEAKKPVDSSWHVMIDPTREYTQKEIIAITRISQPTLSMAKVRGHIVTKMPAGKRGWVVLGSDLLAWDAARAIHNEKKSTPATKKATPVKAKAPAKKAPAQKKVAAAKPKVVAIQKAETKAITVSPAVKAAKKPAAKPATKAPAKTIAAPKTQAKAPVKPAAAKKPVKKPVVKTAKSAAKTAAKPGSESSVPIPNDIADRINALTAKKKVTQTQFGTDVDLPQKVIYEISTRKLKELSPAVIQKINVALKKYESK